VTDGPTDEEKRERPEWARYKRPVPDEAGSDPDRDQTPADGGVEPTNAASGGAAHVVVAALVPDDVPAPDRPAPDAPVEPSPSPAAVISSAPVGPPAWDPGPPISNELEARIRRDLGRGRWIVRLTWIAALASLVLGLVAVRQAALLVAIDPRLVTTEEVEAAGAWFDALRSVLLLGLVLGLVLAIRWLRGAVPVFAELREHGVIDGPPPRTARLRDRVGLLWRASGVPADRSGWADLRVGDGRRMAIVAGVAVALATAVGLVAAIWLGAARDADTSRLLRVVSGIDGALWLVASVLVGVAFDAILWREAAAARALGVFIPLVDAPGRALFRLVPPILIFVAGIFVASARPDPWYVPCPEATLTCDGMLVPVDHDGGSHATIWIVYAIHHAAGAPVGTLAIAVGGPGGSGLDASLGTLETLDPDLVRRYDILFFDQRGVGASEGRDCPAAGRTYATSEPGPDAARAFADACIRESGVDPSTLGRYATRQAAEDLESIRARIGVDRIALYGESYGTELAQAYAAAHPDRVSVLILDGAVDLTRTANAFWSDAATGFGQVLTDTLAACTADPDCHADVADPDTTYDRLLRQYDTADDVSFADPDGVVRTHPLTDAAFESAVDVLLYEPVGRMLIERAVAAFAHDDPVPAARLVDALGSGEGVGVSSFAYHAITCADYRVSPSADPHDIQAVEQAGVAAGITSLRTDEVYTTQYPCLFWSYQPSDATRPAPLTTTPFPVFVLGATADPITPIDQARAIADRLSDGYLIVTTGGSHVSFGRHDECVDGPVLDFLLAGRRPASRSITCDGAVTERYVPLTASTESGYTDALDTMRSTEAELFADPDYLLRDGAADVRIGCRHGGFIAITPTTTQDNIRFADCSFVAGLPLRGTGTYDYADGMTTWSVTAPDGELDYVATDDRQHVSGTWKGASVDLTH
jgi:pimeloyl-ACP methyl ester carboxylesterase